MNRSHGKDGGVLQWLLEQGEERVTQIAQDLSRNKGVTDALRTALKQASRTKGRIDHNVQTLLALLNVPSKADYQKMLTKIETLQGSLVNLNVKLDRLLAAQQKSAPGTKHKKSSANRKKHDPDLSHAK